MNRLTHLTAIAALAVGLSACNRAPTLDASTPLTLKESSQKIRSKLEPADAKRFDTAVTLVIAATLDPMQTIDLAAQGTMPTQQGVFDRLKPAFHGKTFEEVVDLGESSATQVRANLATWRAKQGELKGRYDRYLGGTQVVSKFSPVAANLEPVRTAFAIVGDNQVIVDVTFRNELDKPVESVDFMVGLAPPGISNPWVREQVKHRFEAPIAPGGQANIRTKPIYVNVPESYRGPVQFEAIFDVTRLDLKGAKPVVVPTWSEENMMMIAKLETSISQMESLLQTVAPAKG